MKKLLSIVGAAFLTLGVAGPVAAAVPANPTAQVCYSAVVTVNGEDVVSQAACIPADDLVAE